MKTYNTGDHLSKQEVAEFIQQSGAQLSDAALQELLKEGDTFEIVEITLANVATDVEPMVVNQTDGTYAAAAAYQEWKKTQKPTKKVQAIVAV